jgi:cell division transport system permease protein
MAFLSGLFLMTLSTLDHQLGTTRGETAFQIYWHPDTDMDQIREQWQSYPLMPGFQYAKTYSPSQALQELGQRLGRRGTLEESFPFLAEKSPLPATALISLAPKVDDIDAWTEESREFFSAQPGVARVVATPLRDELGRAWRTVSRYAVWPSVCFLTLVLGLVVTSTVRLSLVARAHEIEILQLAGAYAWYIRLPLIIGGATVGMTGALIALGLLRLLHSQIRDVLNFPPLLMEIQFLTWPMTLALIAVPTLTAALAARLTVRDR